MGKAGWIIIGVIVAFFIALAFYNSNSTDDKQSTASVWSEQMTKGDPEAPNTFTEYTDVTCPHCAEFHNAATEGTFEEDYIESGKVRMEIRVTSMLANNNSVRAGESAYCAADQGKFHEYYDTIVKKFTKDYFDKGIGISPTSPKVPKLDDKYYLDAAVEVDIDTEKMATCLTDNEQLDMVNANTRKAANALPYGSGVPYFVINKFTSSGFGGDYSAVQQMMRAGGIN